MKYLPKPSKKTLATEFLIRQSKDNSEWQIILKIVHKYTKLVILDIHQTFKYHEIPYIFAYIKDQLSYLEE